MNARLFKATSLGLAALYALLAAFGHSMHTHGGCGDDRCGAAVCEQSAGPACSCCCSCPGDNHPAGDQQGPTDDDSAAPAWRSGYPQPAGHDCTACRVLSQLSVGYCVAFYATLIDSGDGDVAPEYHAPSKSLRHQAQSARGPPAAFSA